MISVRAYRRDDQPSVRLLHDRARPPWWTAPEPPPWFADLDRIEDHFRAFWVAVPTSQPERVVGMVGADPSWSEVPEVVRAGRAPAIYLARMRVDPDFQRRGIGSRLCRVLIEWARSEGYDAVITNTTTDQPAAAALYQQVGFVEVTRTKINDDSDHIWYVFPPSHAAQLAPEWSNRPPPPPTSFE